ncbi:pirin-related protein [Phenylobacterium zucineum HLK1]|uniref:Pirin-related protein n=1 Tax=Phenylobacterium zucineum (strain HLK1) TaxID=450851 RepID=B4R839_PHEZH|nr:pirin family protein [Phenylobacterium zucineum]ACG77572.1 pirin-related protein [Phenylobacterium zucineum HLK1]
MPAKTVIAQHAAHRDDIGDLVTRRPLPGPGVDQVDPFLFLNHHGPQVYPPGNRGLPFGPHPHRGFETVTFILDGELAHRDSAGHESIIRAGGVQWMTAGSGLIHAEVSPDDFMRRGGPLEILQLWVNLPSRLKMTRPRYVGVQADEIPELSAGDGATVRLIAGTWGGVTGAVPSLTGVFMATVELKRGARAGFGALQGRNVFCYVARGEAAVNGVAASACHLVQLDLPGDTVELEGLGDGALVVFGHAQPLGEPVVAHGPFVMNTREEIVEAIRDYQAGLFDNVSA